LVTQNSNEVIHDGFLNLDNLFDAQDDRSSGKPIDPTASSVLETELNRSYPGVYEGATVSSNPIDFGTPKEEVIEKVLDGTVPQEAAKPSSTVINNVTYETNNYSSSNNSTSNRTVSADNSNHATSSPSSIIASENFAGNNYSTDDVAYNTYVNSNQVSDISKIYERELKERSTERSASSSSDVTSSSVIRAQYEANDLSERALEDRVSTVYNSMLDKNDVTNVNSVNGGSIVDGVTSIDGTVENNSSNTSNNTYVKSGKIMDQSTIARAIEPDKSVEHSVKEQTKVLNETINNLNTAVSNMTPAVSQPVVTNEGSTTNNSSSTTINSQERKTQPIVQEAKQVELPDQENNTEFYLQAIYAALVSGKVKVKLEYT